MADEKKIVNYQGNSIGKKDLKAEVSEEREPRVGKVTQSTGVIRKKTLGSKIAEMFTGDDARSVGQYVVMDVLIPSAKNMLSDALTTGVERFLFGDSRPRSRSYGGAGYTSYNRMGGRTTTGAPPWKEEPRTMSHRARATHDFSEVILPTRGEAEDVLDQLGELCENFGAATVADLYDSVGITGNFTDNKWGWKSMHGSQVRHVREGYLLDMPRPEILD